MEHAAFDRRDATVAVGRRREDQRAGTVFGEALGAVGDGAAHRDVARATEGEKLVGRIDGAAKSQQPGIRVDSRRQRVGDCSSVSIVAGDVAQGTRVSDSRPTQVQRLGADGDVPTSIVRCHLKGRAVDHPHATGNCPQCRVVGRAHNTVADGRRGGEAIRTGEKECSRTGFGQGGDTRYNAAYLRIARSCETEPEGASESRACGRAVCGIENQPARIRAYRHRIGHGDQLRDGVRSAHVANRAGSVDARSASSPERLIQGDVSENLNGGSGQNIVVATRNSQSATIFETNNTFVQSKFGNSIRGGQDHRSCSELDETLLQLHTARVSQRGIDIVIEVIHGGPDDAVDRSCP